MVYLPDSRRLCSLFSAQISNFEYATSRFVTADYLGSATCSLEVVWREILFGTEADGWLLDSTLAYGSNA